MSRWTAWLRVSTASTSTPSARARLPLPRPVATTTRPGTSRARTPRPGDLPNLPVNEAGAGRLNATTDRVTLSDGPTTLFDGDGSAFIIHANPDDQVPERGHG